MEIFLTEGPFKLTETLYGSKSETKNHLRIHDSENGNSVEK